MRYGQAVLGSPLNVSVLAAINATSDLGSVCSVRAAGKLASEVAWNIGSVVSVVAQGSTTHNAVWGVGAVTATFIAGTVKSGRIASTGSAVGDSRARAISTPVQWCRFRYYLGDSVLVNGQTEKQPWVVVNFYHVRTNRYVVTKNGWFCDYAESELCTKPDYFSHLEAVTDKLGRLPPRPPPDYCPAGG